MKNKKSTKKYTAGELWQLLKLKYAAPQYALFQEVRNGTGYARRQERYCDAIAMCLWPSMGIELHGFEIKVTYSDWKRELADPSKSAEFIQYCDKWWIVAPKGVVPVGELPANWGLLEPKVKHLGITKSASTNENKKALDPLIIASIFRRQHEQLATFEKTHVPVRDIETRLRAEYDRGMKDAQRGPERRAYEKLKKSVEDFEKASGLRIDAFNGPTLGAQVRALNELGDKKKQEFELLKSQANSLQSRAANFAERLQALVLDLYKDEHAIAVPKRDPEEWGKPAEE